MACAWLAAALGLDVPPLPAALEGRVDAGRWLEVARLAATGLASPLTSSVGRLFDAVAALCGLRARAVHEGQAAMELEWVADRAERGSYAFSLVAEPAPGAVASDEPAPPHALDAREAIRSALADLRRGTNVPVVAARFHNGLAAATADACAAEAERRGIELVVLSGGVFQNTLLLGRTRALAEERGLRVLVPERLPPNDGGISFGQAAVAATQLAG
jgi:hydrogenase maturation protein HypF